MHCLFYNKDVRDEVIWRVSVVMYIHCILVFFFLHITYTAAITYDVKKLLFSVV
jgi:hypothetical protein